jgi:hypothetical protein
MIITATKVAMGILEIHSSRNTTTIINNKQSANTVDKRPRPADLILITDWPTMPPSNPAPR